MPIESKEQQVQGALWEGDEARKAGTHQPTNVVETTSVNLLSTTKKDYAQQLVANSRKALKSHQLCFGSLLSLDKLPGVTFVLLLDLSLSCQQEYSG